MDEYMKLTSLESWIAHKIGLTPGTFTLDALHAYQLAQIRNTVAVVKKQSPFYRRKLVNIDPEDLSDFGMISQLPFTYPGDIEADPRQLVCVPQETVQRIVTLSTSGTSGQTKRLYFTGEDQELTIDFFEHGMKSLVEAGDSVLILMPGERPGGVGDLLKIALERLGVRAIPYGYVNDPEDAIATAILKDADVLVGVPTQVLGMARHRKGRMLNGRIKGVLLSADHVAQAICRALQDIWACPVFNHYGMTEMGLGGGVECSALSGYHLREADLYLEIVCPETGRPVREGEEGEVVFTTLTIQGMPLVRYRTGDLGRLIPEPCSCGTQLRRLDVIRKRIGGQVILAGKILTMADLDEVLFAFDGITDFQAQLADGDGQDLLTIKIGKEYESGWNSPAVMEALNSIPALGEAVAGGRARVVLENGCAGWAVSGGARKRTVMDLRQTSNVDPA
jgi:phenylacetate-coenzyme A ligase PaaK-like adenylate-forming protein